MLPHEPAGVVVRRKGRLKESAQFPAPRLRESACFPYPMSRAANDDQEDFAPGALDRALQEQEEDSGVDAALADDPHGAKR
jgi:hypothetical protein